MPIKFHDSIHEAIVLPDRLRPILESPALRRLRNIRQLGFTISAYSGATHTRFEHTLGTTAVLSNLLAQFSALAPDQRIRYLQSALLSEIGIFPLSYSGRSIFEAAGLDKKVMQKLLYEAFVAVETGVSWIDEERFASNENPLHSWFYSIPGMRTFKYLTPIKLASMIDYVLRDSYYSGRYSLNFDYRYFQSIALSDDYETEREVRGSLSELHRAAYALNSIYGDKVRRFLTAVLHRLVMRLVEGGHFNILQLKDPHQIIELDDDTFLSRIEWSVRLATAGGDDLCERMFQIVAQTRLVQVLYFPSDEELLALPKAEIEAHVARRIGTDPSTIICLGGTIADGVGFRLFGSEYPTYAAAIRSEQFAELTGLCVAEDKTGLERSGKIAYIML